jgi:hypothetical protein
MKFLLIFIVVSMSSIAVSKGNDKSLKESKSDVSLKAGVGVWTITQPLENGSERTVTYGGLPISVGYYIDYSQSYTVQLGGQMVFDIIGTQISGTGGYVMLAWHLMGGARYNNMNAEYASIVRRNPYNFSALLKSALLNYSASRPDDVSSSLSGQAFEFMVGFEYRKDWGQENSFGVEFLQTLFSVPSGKERISPSGTEMGVFWRFLL